MNKFIGIGRLTKAPEMRKTTNGKSNTTFTIAINRNFKTKEGEQEADYIGCSAWNKLADTISKYCTKGMLVAVEGRLQIRNYEKEGTKRYLTEILVENISFLSKGNKEKEPTDSEIVQSVMNDEDPFAFLDDMELKEDDFPW
jgi:single-strand DNA-binding protein